VQALGYRSPLTELASYFRCALDSCRLMQAQFTYFLSAEIRTMETQRRRCLLVIYREVRGLWRAGRRAGVLRGRKGVMRR